MIKLNIGSGYQRIDGFLNIDNDPLVKPDYLIDLELPNFPIDENSVNEIRAHYILGHIGPGFMYLMKELYRVCCNDAILDIKFPHHLSNMYFNDPTHIRALTIEQFKLFSKKYNQWHIDTYNSCSGLGLKFDIDFEIVGFSMQPTPGSQWETALQHKTGPEIEQIATTYNNVFQEVNVKLKVVK